MNSGILYAVGLNVLKALTIFRRFDLLTRSIRKWVYTSKDKFQNTCIHCQSPAGVGKVPPIWAKGRLSRIGASHAAGVGMSWRNSDILEPLHPTTGPDFRFKGKSRK